MLSRRGLIFGSAASLVAGQSADAFFKKGWLTVSQLQSSYLLRNFGIFSHFSMATFLDSENPAAGQPLSNYAVGPNWAQICQNIRAAKKLADPYIYAAFTQTHADGFVQRPTSTTTYNVTNTPWYAANGHIDVTGSFVSTCQSMGIIPVLYICAKDLTFEAANPGFTQQQYLTYKQAQIVEMLNAYPGLGGVWLDADNIGGGGFPSQGYPWASCGAATAFVTGARQNLITINNCQGSFVLSESNIVEYEGGTFPGEFVGPGNVDPAESCETIYNQQTWFWKSTSPALRSTSTMISNIALANSRTSNYLLNFPPDNTGNIESRMTAVMAQIGAR